ncbi:aminotransferase class V-fold PLP-dependent enzyme [Calditerricola satsumensis]|uniref:cysteine desulfurase n=1 Tax=Calditerricola satsumensis TaxID=373054 RepID=A0A8J3BC71_9BACI|nr:aminotransferase class V-fold PLP-dependent enzyme [Calditerricola satsumensis]GGJ97261.1 cysteine desulfurase [Calditerricola satsumensis]
MTRTIRYLDNAASTWPKPPAVVEAMKACVEAFAANPGRGSHALAQKAARVVAQARAHLARLFGVRNPNDLFFFANATQALNQALKGYLRAGDHVVASAVEHNAVRRPLEHLRRTRGVEVTYVPPRENGLFAADDFLAALRPNTRLVAVTHASNVTGVILPVADIGERLRSRGVPLLVDASQTAGVLPIDVTAMNIALLAFPGHKGLYGPQGTGGLYAAPDLELEPLVHGGTGSHSEEADQPAVRPERYESGTLNTPGIAGLLEGVKFVLETGVEILHRHEWGLARETIERLSAIPGVRVYGPPPSIERIGVVSFSIAGVDPAEVAAILDREYGIAVRAGLHCSPLGHETIGTRDGGTVRASFGYFNGPDDVEALAAAVREIAAAFS